MEGPRSVGVQPPAFECSRSASRPLYLAAMRPLLLLQQCNSDGGGGVRGAGGVRGGRRLAGSTTAESEKRGFVHKDIRLQRCQTERERESESESEFQQEDSPCKNGRLIDWETPRRGPSKKIRSEKPTGYLPAKSSFTDRPCGRDPFDPKPHFMEIYFSTHQLIIIRQL